MSERFFKLLDNYIETYDIYSKEQLNQFRNEILGELDTLDELSLIEISLNLNNRLNSNNELIKIIDRDLLLVDDFMRPEKLEDYSINMEKTRGEALVDFNNYIINQKNKKTEALKIVNILQPIIYYISSQLNNRLENLSTEDKNVLASKLNDFIQNKEENIERLETEIASRKLKIQDTEELYRVAQINGLSIGEVKSKYNSENRDRYEECQKEQSAISFYKKYVEMLNVAYKR